MKPFYHLLLNNLVASITTTFAWFALTFWVYLETENVLATSIIAGVWAVLSASLGIVFGTYVDQHKKKSAMMLSSIISLLAFAVAGIMYWFIPQEQLLVLASIQFWVFVFFILLGAVAANLRAIALSTCVSILVPKEKHSNTNGLIGSTSGVSFALTSVLGGLGIGFLGMGWSLVGAIVVTLLALLHLLWIAVPEEAPVKVDEATIPETADKHAHGQTEKASTSSIDFKGALQAIQETPGLLGMILFATFNNFLGGVFMSLMDAYGLSLVSVQTWGLIWGFLSSGFIIGGLIVAKRGLGKNPVYTLFMLNNVLWVICIFFTIKESIVLTSVGLFAYMVIGPAIEASEQTIIQRVVPLPKQGRVFGFAQTVEQAASPVTAFLIGPIAQLVVIPFMSEGGGGVDLIGSWFGTGQTRAIALIFTITGCIGLIVTVLAMGSTAYKRLSAAYVEPLTPKNRTSV